MTIGRGDHLWKRVEDLYHAALEYAPAEREAFVSSACGDDLELRREDHQGVVGLRRDIVVALLDFA